MTQTGYTTKKSSNPLIILCVLWDTSHELFCVFVGDFYISGTQAAEVTKSLHSIDTRDCCIPGGSFFFLKACIRLESSEKIRASRCNSNSYRQCHIFIQNVQNFPSSHA